MFRGDSYIGRQNNGRPGIDTPQFDSSSFVAKFSNKATAQFEVPGASGNLTGNVHTHDVGFHSSNMGKQASAYERAEKIEALERAEKIEALAMIDQEITEMSTWLAVRKRISVARKRRQELEDALFASDAQSSAAVAAKRRCPPAAMAAAKRMVPGVPPGISNAVAASVNSPAISNAVAARMNSTGISNAVAASMNSFATAHASSMCHSAHILGQAGQGQFKLPVPSVPRHPTPSMPSNINAAGKYQQQQHYSQAKMPPHFASARRIGVEHNKTAPLLPVSVLSSDPTSLKQSKPLVGGGGSAQVSHPSDVEAVAIHSEAKASVEAALRKNLDFTMPTPQDVLMGRGMAANAHEGNQKFLSFVGTKKKEYVTSVKKEKTVIAQSIVDEIHTRGGRFLQQSIGGMWSEVDNNIAREKCSRALRDPENRDVMGTKNEAATSLVELASKESAED
jgi:hypothetical protein